MIDNFFDRIYILNLTRRVERKENTRARLEKVGITNYEFFRAVDGRLLPAIWLDPRSIYGFRFYFTFSNNSITKSPQ